MTVSREDRHALKLAYLYVRTKRERRRLRIEMAVSVLPLDARTLFTALTLLLLED